MMRCDQLRGLNEWALDFIKGELAVAYIEEATRVYPDGRREIIASHPVYKALIKREDSGESFFGMFGTLYPLHKYTFLDGRVYFEKLQAAPWSSGPVHFLALQDENGNWVPESLWSEEVIKAA